MKIQKQKTRKDKDYYKYVLVIPSEVLKKSGFEPGDEVEVKAKKGRIEVQRG